MGCWISSARWAFPSRTACDACEPRIACVVFSPFAPMKTAARILATMGLATILAGSAIAEVDALPFDQIKPGMRGVGRTVFHGNSIDEFEVEVLGTLPNIGPDQNLILARLSGGPLAETGVLAGMSGSPVFVDGKLIGAVAYSWGFSKEAIAGITPIHEMLAIVQSRSGPRPERTASVDLSADTLGRLFSAPALAEFFRHDLGARLARPAGALRSTLPLAVAGLGAEGLGRVASELTAAGLVPLQAGGSSSAARGAGRLEAGSPVGVQLVRGDIEFTATGTVTWVEGDQVLAFGHPLFALGAVDLPLTGATVQALLPSVQQSSRIATPLGEVGALRQDRSSGVLGSLHARPRMIPVRLELAHAGIVDRVYSFDIADDPLLSPLLLYVTLNGIVAGRERTIGMATVRIGDGSVIKLGRGTDVALDNVFSGPEATDFGTGVPAYILYLLMNNAWNRPAVTGINLRLDHDVEPRTAQIRRVSLDRYRARAGDVVEAAVVVAPYRGRDLVLSHTVPIPKETPPGPLVLHVAGASAASRAESRHDPVIPRDFDQLVRLINQLRRNDRIFIAATREDPGALLGGSRLPNLPPSVAHVLSHPRQRGDFLPVRQRSVLEETIATQFAVEGEATIELEVVAP